MTDNNVKVAVVEVWTCGGCPYFEWDQTTPYCAHPERVKKLGSENLEDGPIPDWCPLPNKRSN